MTLWNRLGFSQNPYSVMPIPADEKGEQLLVGRKEELDLLIKYIKNSDTHPTLEGPNGVGKTSLVAVAGYKLKTEFTTGVTNQALLPLAEPFQLTTSDTAATFKRLVFYRVAQAFIENHELLKSRGFKVPDVDNVNLWLNSPTFGSVGGGLTVLGIGGNATVSTTTNSSVGFTEAGFIATVTNWLKECFTDRSMGGFLCNIDNLELLETSKNARNLLEAIRDEVLRVPGLRWVLCGARGIVRTAASSQRLQSVLSEPTDINPISHDCIRQLISARLEVFKLAEVDEIIAPVDEVGFDFIYRIFNNNLRTAMKYSEDFSMAIPEEVLMQLSPAQRFAKLEEWMAEIAKKHLKATTGVKARAWQVFDKLTENGGGMSPSEFSDYGFESAQALRPHIRDLEEANLVESTIDEVDDRRRMINVTSRGWIVFKHRHEAQSSSQPAPSV